MLSCITSGPDVYTVGLIAHIPGDSRILKAHDTRPRGYKTFFSCSTQLSTKFILLINVKMQTMVDILTFISMINKTSKRHKARNFFICRYISFYELLKFRAQLS